MIGLGSRVKKPTKKVITMFRPNVRSQHSTHDHLRNSLNRTNKRVVVRLGSTTTLQEIYSKKLTSEQMSKVLEINTVQAIKNSASKLLMKQCFTTTSVKTADWWTINNGNNQFNCLKSGQGSNTPISQLPFPIVAKSHFGSRGEGNTKIDNQQQLETWMRGKTLSNYIFEKYYNYNREYRLHVTANGCFYTCRKVLKSDTPEEQRWYRNDSNCSWLVEGNASFDKPSNWDAIVAECVKALNSTGLDIGGFDVKVQSAQDGHNRTRPNPDFIIIESNSACSHGDVTAEKYKVELNRLINDRTKGRS